MYRLLPTFLAVIKPLPEGKQYVDAMNRAQQAYFLEKNSLSDKIGNLALNIATETENYTYSMQTTPLSAFHYGVSRQSQLNGYVGGIFFSDIEETGELTTLAILCEAQSPGTTRPPAPIVEEGVIKCAPETVNLKGDDQNGIIIGEDWNLAYRSANYASAGEYNQALDMAETITDDLIKAKVLQVIATELVAAGKPNQALTIIERIQAIALKLTNAGEYTQALKVTPSITHDSIRSNTLQAIAPYLTNPDHHEQALQVAKTLTDYQDKAKALDAIVRRLAATGEHERAVQIAQTIQSYYGGKEKAMAAIARYQNSP